jgi:hypothetical protein
VTIFRQDWLAHLPRRTDFRDAAACRRIHSVARPMGGQPKSNAWGDTSSAVRHSAQEPTEATSQNHWDAVGITLGRGGCQPARSLSIEPD